MKNMTNNTKRTLIISYFDGSEDEFLIPTSFSEDFKVTGDKEVAKENFDNIIKKFPAWVVTREQWFDRYYSIRESLKGNPNRNYVLEMILNNDHPDSWKYNTAQEDIGIGCIYSFRLIRMIGDKFFTTGPWLFITGYPFCEPKKKIFEVKIPLELVQ